MSSTYRRAGLGIAALTLTVAAMEILLTLVTLVSPKAAALLAPPTSQASPTIPDVRLGHRPNPAYPGHDAKGFRNPSVPEAVDIVALGDSQTYGSGVEGDEAWPARLQALSGYRVYNMAFGGWGPTHSLVLFDEALAMKPRLIIEAFYGGNDLYDAFNMVYNRGQLPEFQNPSADVREAVRAAERSQPLAVTVSRLYQAGDLYPQHSTVRSFLAMHSKIYGLLRAIWYETQQRLVSDVPAAAWNDAKARAAAAPDPTTFEIFEEGERRTIFNSSYRLTGLDLDDVRIGEGLRIALAAIDRMSERAESEGIGFLVILLPTKQQVFRPFVARPSPSFESLVHNEDQMWTTAGAHFAERGIDFIDTLPSLRQQLASGPQPYAATHDDHPSPAGQVAIAKAIDAGLGRRLAGQPQAPGAN